MGIVEDYYQHHEGLRRLIRSMLADPADFVLDIGCKEGTVSKSYADNVRQLVGLDITYSCLWQTDPGGICYVNADGQALPFKEGAFDIAVASECLQYIPCPHLVIEECRRVLRCGGYLVLSFPERGIAATYLDPYNLVRILRRLLLPDKRMKPLVKHLCAKELLSHMKGRWECLRHYRRGSVLFIYAAAIADVLQSARGRLLDGKTAPRRITAACLGIGIQILFVLMRADFRFCWSRFSYNNIIHLRKVA